MRITNKIMQNNNLSNLNTNKVYQDRLTNMMSTQKKINRPSDDPVIAIRALRLRSNVMEVTQYYERNIPDAEQWLNVTEDALKTLAGVIENMQSLCTKGASGELTSVERQILMEDLRGLADEVYATGDADFAGRYVFTGYRTDTSLSFREDGIKQYTITEQINNTAIDTQTIINTTYVDTTTFPPTVYDLTDINASNYSSVNVTEQDVESMEVHRIRLAYKDCDETGTVTITFTEPVGAAPPYSPVTADMRHAYDDPYTEILAAGNEDKVFFVPETGELLLGVNIYNRLMELKDLIATTGMGEDESEIQVSYVKDKWVKGDLRPEHYFYCVSDQGTADEIIYNPSYILGNLDKQSIEYDVGFNQSIRVNSTADECFNHGVGREVDDLAVAMEEMVKLESVKAELEKLLKAQPSGSAAAITIQVRLDAVNKAVTLQKDKVQKMFESAITAMQGYLDDANLSVTDCGTRGSKLDLVKVRMQTQKTTFETLQSENEDVDVTEVAIHLTSAEFTYQAALLAIGKIAQTSLLNYI